MKHLGLAVAVGILVMLSSAQAQQFSDWSEPVNLGPVVNDSTANDFVGAISKDGLSLYFASNRLGGFGTTDVYVSHRATVNDPWGPPINLGPNVNTSGGEGPPSLSPDEHRLYFQTIGRVGTLGSRDIYVTRRHNRRDDFAWQPAENLGPPVNSAADERQPEVFEDDATGVISLYFGSDQHGGLGDFDIYVSTLQPDESWGVPDSVEGINSAFNEQAMALRRDGLEMILQSNRPGTLGLADLWISTRAATTDPWETPVNLGAPVNTSAGEANPTLSFDGTELYFTRGGDIFVSTRTKIGH